jgi:endonuclease/exonuclease/phosphatase (EEP) superfamily protein YafD
MKLLCLNTWGARRGEELFDFVAKYRQQTDFFCLQEIWYSRQNRNSKLLKLQVVNQMQRLAEILEDFTPIFCPFETNVNNYDGSDPADTMFGIAVFVRTSYLLESASEEWVYLKRNNLVGMDAKVLGRNIQQVGIQINGKVLNLFNFHGLWNGLGKKDTPERLEQSRKVVEFMQKFDNPKILCGDFNLEPETESLGIIKQGLRDLIKEYKISDTRTIHYEKSVRFADYVFVSNDVKVNNFEVLPEAVSDHAALFLDFEI